MTKANKKPDWLRVRAPVSDGYRDTERLMRGGGLHTVCEEAACPNIGECWQKRHATVMILGDICTRACRFCNVQTGKPLAVDPLEPENLALAVQKMNLSHVVITSVDRDDLPDGGAEQFAKCIKKVREISPDTTIEVLTPDFRGKEGALELVVAAKPDVFNHNIETVPRLFRDICPSSRYFYSLFLLKRVKEMDAEIFTKSGVMVGLGETDEEILQVMDDMRCADIDFITIGQYLRPTPKHADVVRYVEPATFEMYKTAARGKGFLMVASSPLTRSSYHAGDDFEQMRINRLKRLENLEKSDF